MTTDSSSESEGDLFLLAAVALSLDFAQKKGKRKKKTVESKSMLFLLDLLGVSRRLLPLRLLARRTLHPQKWWCGGGFILGCEDFRRMFDHSFPACAFLFFFFFFFCRD